MIWQLVKKDLLRRFKNPIGFVLLILLPLILVGLMGLVFSPNNNNEILPKVKLLIEDHDQSFVSKLVPGAFSRDQLAKMFEVEQIEKDSGQELMNKGKASALLIIPEGFGKAILDGNKTELILVKNPSEAFSPKIAEETVAIFAEGADRLLRIADKPMQSIRTQFYSDEDPTDTKVAQVSVLINQLIMKVQDYLFPPLITIAKNKVSENEKNNSNSINIFGYILAGVMVMSLLFVLDSVAKDIFQERENLTLYRLQTTPIRSSHYIISKLISIGSIGLASHLLVWLVGSIIFQIKFNFYQVLIFIPFSIVLLFALTGVILCLYSMMKTRSQASAIIPMFIIFFSMLGGSMIPMQSLPPIMQKLAVVSPVYWGVNGLEKIVLTNENVTAVLPNLTVLLLIGSATVSVAIPILFRRLRT